LVGSVIWFIPPMAASILYPDIAGMVSSEFSNPSELAYVVMAQNILPNGMLGLFIVGMFAATMSSMDTGLNKNAGYFIINFYKPILRKNSSEKEQFWAGNIASLIMGFLVIGIALYLEVLANQGEGKGLFEIMLSFGAIVAVPIAVPVILCLFVKNTPDWAGWSCALVGVVTALLIQYIFTASWFEELIGRDITGREEGDYLYIATVLLNVALVSGWFFFTKRFYRGYSKDRQVEVDQFWSDIHRPVEADETTSELDAPQCRIIGWMSTVFGAFMALLMVIIPNGLTGRGAFFFCAAILLIIGGLLLRSAKRADLRHSARTAEG